MIRTGSLNARQFSISVSDWYRSLASTLMTEMVYSDYRDYLRWYNRRIRPRRFQVFRANGLTAAYYSPHNIQHANVRGRICLRSARHNAISNIFYCSDEMAGPSRCRNISISKRAAFSYLERSVQSKDARIREFRVISSSEIRQDQRRVGEIWSLFGELTNNFTWRQANARPFSILFVGIYCRTPPPSIWSRSIMTQIRTDYYSDGLAGSEITSQPASSVARNVVQSCRSSYRKIATDIIILNMTVYNYRWRLFFEVRFTSLKVIDAVNPIVFREHIRSFDQHIGSSTLKNITSCQSYKIILFNQSRLYSIGRTDRPIICQGVTIIHWRLRRLITLTTSVGGYLRIIPGPPRYDKIL